jgi:hypothetical protein
MLAYHPRQKWIFTMSELIALHKNWQHEQFSLYSILGLYSIMHEIITNSRHFNHVRLQYAV